MVWKASSQISQASSNLPTPSCYKPWIRTAGEERPRASALPVHLLWMLLCLAGFSGSPLWHEHMLLRVMGLFFIMIHGGSVTLSELGVEHLVPACKGRRCTEQLAHASGLPDHWETREEVAAPWLEPKLPRSPHMQLPHPFPKHREGWWWESGCPVLLFPGLNLSFAPSYENLPFALALLLFLALPVGRWWKNFC